LTPEWKRAATALKGIVKLGAVDADSHQALGQQYGVSGFPTIKIFGANKQSPTNYQGGRTADAIVEQALSLLKTIVNERLGKRGGGGSSSGGSGGSGGKDAVDLTDSNFQVDNLNFVEKNLFDVYFLIFSQLFSIQTNHGLLNLVSNLY
jgi:protein disulfide-isomerase A6